LSKHEKPQERVDWSRGDPAPENRPEVGPAPAFVEGSDVPLSVWYLPRPEDTTIQARSMREVIRAFEARHPNIRLSSPAGLAIPEMSAMDTQPLMAIAGGVSPDVIYVNFRQSDTYIREGFLYPLDRWMDRLPEPEKAERLPAQVLRVVRRAGPPVGGHPAGEHFWALPYNTYIKGLCWRKDVFQSAGLDPETPPRTWDELLAFARRCTDPSAGTYGIAWGRGPHWSAHFYSILCSAGARAMTETAPGEWAASFHSTEAATAYMFMLELVQGRWRHPSGRTMEGVVYREPDASLLWQQGRIAMVERYFTDDLLADVSPELVGLAPVPAAPGGKRASELNCTMCGIFSGAAAKGPEVLDAAWQYVHFLGSPEAKAIRTRVLVENGYGLFANPVQLEKLGYTDLLREVPAAWRQAYETAMANAEPEPYGRNCQMIYNYMSAPADRLLMEKCGQKAPAEARRRVEAVLADYAGRANERLAGRVDPAAMRIRRAAAAAVVAAVAAGFVLLFRFVLRAFAMPPAPVASRSRRHSVWPAALLLLPAALTVLLWRYFPLGWGAVISMQDFHLVLPSRWTWLDNFAAVLWDPEFWRSLAVSAWYAVLSLALGFVAPIALAILLHELPRGRVAFRVVYYLPAVLSGLVVMLMWKAFFEPSDRGLLNQLVTATPRWAWMSALGLAAMAFIAGGWTHLREGNRGVAAVLGACGLLSMGAMALVWYSLPFAVQRWLDDPRWAMPCVILPTVWAGIGPGCLIYLAALKTVPEELYEAADLDGAGFFGKLRHVTLPTIRVLIYINFVGAVIHGFQVSEYILAMTGGGPSGLTEVLALKVFYDAFVYLRFGFATAAAWLLGAMLIGLTVLQLRRMASVEFKAAEER
jgi:multiple sugar transport system permease protein